MCSDAIRRAGADLAVRDSVRGVVRVRKPARRAMEHTIARAAVLVSLTILRPNLNCCYFDRRLHCRRRRLL